MSITLLSKKKGPKMDPLPHNPAQTVTFRRERLTSKLNCGGVTSSSGVY